MANFEELNFSPADFARLAKIDKSFIPALETQGLVHTIRKRVGNVDRKLIPIQSVQNYFRTMRDMIHQFDHEEPPAPGKEMQGDGAVAAGQPIPVEALQKNPSVQSEEDYIKSALVAAATGIRAMPPTHKIQMFYNVKGGTGKSTLTAQYVMRAALMGYRVLALDLDGQGHLTVNLNILDSHERPTIYDVLINDLPIEQAVITVAPYLDLVPANLGLCNIEIPLNQKPRREYRLSEAIQRIAPHYDLIVADTNPAASILNCSMLVAADLVNVVCATNPLSFHGMSLVMSTLEEMQREFRKEMYVKIIPNMYDAREVISQEVLGELKVQFPEHCSKTVVNRSADLNEATKRRTTVLDVNTKGVAAQDLGELTEELLFT